ncbi:MAG: PTS transporter subunit EIIC [Lachnospiraceae bacterium]|nr:PTS transporter subunit EIIC [Lachnospiraceae bacterium]
MKFLQQLGKAIMLPVACMPLCGIMMGIGYLLCPASMQGGAIEGVLPVIGLFFVRAGSALIDHIPLLFAVGIGFGLAKDRDGIAGLAGLVAYLTIITLLQTSFVEQIAPAVIADPARKIAFDKIENPFIGIIAGLIGAFTYNHFKNTRLPDWLAFFSGKRSAVIVTGLLSSLASALLLILWPMLFGGLTILGTRIAAMGPLGAGLYAFLNRLLLPFGLHHPLNNVFWFDSIGLGDLTHFWAGETSADVGWSLGMYMSGFFPCMMFGVPGAVLAMSQCVEKSRRKAVLGILGSAAFCSFVCGITEPFEFSFVFLSPLLYVLYSLLYGLFSFAVALSDFRAGFAFSGGVTDLLFSASLPAAQNTWMILLFGPAAFASFYLVFRVLITKLDIKTPGREAIPNASTTEDTYEAEKAAITGASRTNTSAEKILQALGGKGNIVSLDHCITRLRLEVKDAALVDKRRLKEAGALGVMQAGNSVQVVIGLQVDQTADELHRLLKEQTADESRHFRKEQTIGESHQFTEEQAPVLIRCEAGEIRQPVKGRVISQEEIPDETFSSGIMGSGVGIEPEAELVTAPFDGTILSVADASHAIGLSSGDMEVLIHVGVDTVQMKGDGFTCYVKEGDTVLAGQPLLAFDRAKIHAAGHSDTVAVMLVNSEDLKDVTILKE